MKKEIRGLLEEYRPDRIGERAVRSRRVLGTLLALTYDPDPLIAWRAVEATGVAAACIAEGDPEAVREHLRRLHWLLSEESGGICWRAPETMAEIVRRRPDLFVDWVPIVSHLLVEMAEEDLGHFRVGLLWAIGRLGPRAGDVSEEVAAAIEASLEHPDSRVRGMAVWCLGRLERADILAGHAELGADRGPVEMFEGGDLRATTVAELLERALAGGRKVS